jgi:CRP-like cAMP-binding protein
VFNKGDAGSCMYVVQSGVIEMMIGDKVIEVCGPNEAIGFMSMVDGAPRSSTARVKEACELSLIDQRKFRFMVDEVPNFALYIMGAMARRIRGWAGRCNCRVQAALDRKASRTGHSCHLPQAGQRARMVWSRMRSRVLISLSTPLSTSCRVVGHTKMRCSMTASIGGLGPCHHVAGMTRRQSSAMVVHAIA